MKGKFWMTFSEYIYVCTGGCRKKPLSKMACLDCDGKNKENFNNSTLCFCICTLSTCG